MKILQRLNFKLFASIGTADFYTDHGIKVINYNINFMKLFMLQWHGTNVFSTTIKVTYDYTGPDLSVEHPHFKDLGVYGEFEVKL